MIGLEADRIDSFANARVDRLHAAYLTHLIKIADEFIPKLDADQSPQSVSKEIKERIAEQVQQGDPIDRLALDRARAAVDVGLTDIEARWLSVRTDPELPVARNAGPPRAICMLGGMVAGLLLWLVIPMRRSMMLAFKRLLDERL